MRKARWLAEWRKSAGKPVFYHVISRIVDRRFVLGAEEKEKFRALMRLQEKFTGCRVGSYCLMDNHFHILLEVPPLAEGGLSDEVLLKRLSAIYNEAFVAGVSQELAEARTVTYANETGLDEAMAAIHQRFMTEGQSFSLVVSKTRTRPSSLPQQRRLPSGWKASAVSLVRNSPSGGAGFVRSAGS